MQLLNPNQKLVNVIIAVRKRKDHHLGSVGKCTIFLYMIRILFYSSSHVLCELFSNTAAAKLHNTAAENASVQIGPVTKQCVIVL